MCSNYRPVTSIDRLLTFFGVERDPNEELLEVKAEAWPLGLAPFIRAHESGSGNKVVETGQFGLLPGFTTEVAFGRKTYNARSETVHQLASFKDSWAKSRRCIVPAEAIFEQCYETGKAVRWCIQQPGGVPMGIAGIYRRWTHRATGRKLWSFAMLTINADGHPVFSRMHKPGDEKRMIVILDPADYDRWLTCTPEEAPVLFRQWVQPLDAFAAPIPPRGAA